LLVASVKGLSPELGANRTEWAADQAGVVEGNCGERRAMDTKRLNTPRDVVLKRSVWTRTRASSLEEAVLKPEEAEGSPGRDGRHDRADGRRMMIRTMKNSTKRAANPGWSVKARRVVKPKPPARGGKSIAHARKREPRSEVRDETMIVKAMKAPKGK